MTQTPRNKRFDAGQYAWKPDIDYRAEPERYRVGRGEQGVLIVEPYKSEILLHWRFKTPAIARESGRLIYAMFLDYLERDDFVGADMARKFLQMGFTRARRYTNYKGGKKYGADDQLLPKGSGDPEKAKSADIFFKLWKKAETDPRYAAQRKTWKTRLG